MQYKLAFGNICQYLMVYEMSNSNKGIIQSHTFTISALFKNSV